MKVEVVCTTDDPVDDLRHHRRLREEGFPVKVLPAFRPDKAMAVSDAQAFNDYLDRLEDASGMSITHYQDYLDALRQRHDFFSANGCTVSDHGLEQIDFAAYDEAGLKWIFSRLRSGQAIEPAEVRQIRSALLDVFAEWDHEKGWVQQFHLGAMRNNNTRMKNRLGSDTGWDSIGDYAQAAALSGFLDRADSRNQLARTILYNLNPADNAVMATMAGNFNDGSIPGKIQFGAAWWFLDQKEGMISQMNTLSSMGLLSRFVGMLTDSRSFLSYPRHEYFRRLLCNLIGQDVEKGELPADTAWLGKIVSDICYHNAKKYFNW
jgi:glucuronate isomerase